MEDFGDERKEFFCCFGIHNLLEGKKCNSKDCNRHDRERDTSEKSVLTMF